MYLPCDNHHIFHSHALTKHLSSHQLMLPRFVLLANSQVPSGLYCTNRQHLSRLNVPSWQAIGDQASDSGFTQSHVVQMPGCPVAGSEALFWISAFMGSKHWQRYPPPHQPSSSAQTHGIRSAEGKGEVEREGERQIDGKAGEREDGG